MQKRTGLELLKTFVPLLVYSFLLYLSFKYIDTKPMTYKSVVLALSSALFLFYIVNYRLINLGSRRGVFALLIIMLIAFGLKIYVLISIKNPVHIISGYGILITGLIVTTTVFYFRHLKMRVLESISVSLDKEEYVLNENVNFSVEVAPPSKINVDKMEIEILLSENVQDSKDKILDSVVYREKKELCADRNFDAKDYLRGGFIIPGKQTPTFYGRYVAIFWHVKLTIYFKNKPYHISTIFDVKPEILLRQAN